MTDEKCPCGKSAVWIYMPAKNDENPYACDECVPRNCSFCNRDDDENELPKPWHPCVEWWPINEPAQP